MVLLQKKLTQFSKIENVRSIEKSSLELISNDFEALPLYYMKYFGSTDIDEVKRFLLYIN